MITRALKEIQAVGTNGNGHKVPTVVGKAKGLDMDLVREEIKNPAILSMIEAVNSVVVRASRFEIDKEQAMIEIAGYREIIKLVVMEWNKRR